VPTSINTKHYARIVESDSLRRNLIRAAEKVATLAWDESQGIRRIMEDSERELFKVSQQWAGQGVVSVKSALMDLYDTTLERREAGGKMVGIKTGLVDLDKILRGLKKGNLYILAARPGMGKSTVATQAMLNAGRTGSRVALFNLEMPNEQITRRMIATSARIEQDKLEEGNLTETQWENFTETVGEVSNLPLFIDDSPDLSPSQLRAKSRRLFAEHGIDLVIVDYIQLMDSDRKHHNDTSRITYISRQLKKLAKELDLPVLALSQLNRALEARADKRPKLSDLRDSGALEQDADAVIFIYRDEYYKKDESEVPNVAELIVEKHRNGKIGTASTYFNGATSTLANLQVKELLL
jgi:replicative DNA helicase